jgi:hypothetical protein
VARRILRIRTCLPRARAREVPREHDTPGWFVGTPTWEPRHKSWSQYAFDTTEDVPITARSREWTSVAPTQERVIREMARCLREIAAGRVPR